MNVFLLKKIAPCKQCFLMVSGGYLIRRMLRYRHLGFFSKSLAIAAIFSASLNIFQRLLSCQRERKAVQPEKKNMHCLSVWRKSPKFSMRSMVFNDKTKHVFHTSSFFHCFLKGPPFFRRDSLPPPQTRKWKRICFPRFLSFFSVCLKYTRWRMAKGRGHCSACFVLPPRLKAS